MTKRVRLSILLLGLVFGALALAQSGAGTGVAVVNEVNGTVMMRVGDNPPRPLQVGRRIPSGAVLITGADGSAVITFTDGQVVVLGERTTFQIVDFQYDPKDASRNRDVLNLVAGSARLVMGAIGQQDPRLVRILVGSGTNFGSPGQGAAAAGVTLENTNTMVTVTQGRVALRQPNGQDVLLGSGQGYYMPPSGGALQGDADRIYAQIGQTADGQQIVDWLEAMQAFEFSQRNRRTVITLATPYFPPVVLALPTLETFTPMTAPTGAGGGGTPCGASCN
jgi:ferric-dicitrate binding protein FerR (iron transport regulator)